MTPARIARFLWIFATRGALILLASFACLGVLCGLALVFGDWAPGAGLVLTFVLGIGIPAWWDSRKP